MKKNLIEFIGTFFLVLTICAVIIAQSPIAAIGIGTMLIALIYAGGHISGAHYNPAVTLAMLIHKKISLRGAIEYWIAQFAAGALAAIVSTYLFQDFQEPAILDLHTFPALLAETLGTFTLVFVIFNVAIAKGTAGNEFYGLAIGFTVMGGIYAFGGISGAVFNPAVALGLCMENIIGWDSIWIFFVANLFGALLATFLFRYTEE